VFIVARIAFAILATVLSGTLAIIAIIIDVAVACIVVT
jgi:hypothetical protein